MSQPARQPDPSPGEPGPRLALATETGAPRCGKCGYSLAGIADKGACPECGTPVPSTAWGWPAVAALLKRLGPAAVMGVMAIALPALGGVVLLYFINDVGHWLRNSQPTSIFAYVLAFAFFSGFALLPTYAQAIMGGWAFGFAVGFPAAQVGLVSGAMIGYAIARPTASHRVLPIIAEHPRWEAVRVALVGGGYLKTLMIVTLLRMPPSSPFAMTNLVLASVKVRPSAYALGTFLGTLPRTAMTVFWASQVQNMIASEAAEQVPWWWLGVGIALSITVLGVIGLMAKKALDRCTAGLTLRCAGCGYSLAGLPAVGKCPECGCAMTPAGGTGPGANVDSGS